MKLQNHAYPRRFAVLGAVFAAALFGSVLLGRFSVTPKELFRLLLSRLTETEQGWRDGAENVVFQIRLPRVAAAALIGAALAVAGVSYQGMFRNPMVSPDILGASTGAGFGGRWPSCSARAISAFRCRPSCSAFWQLRRPMPSAA